MPLEAWITLALLMVMFGLLIMTKWPAWVIFLGALTAAMTLNLAPTEDLLKGFSNPGVLTVGVLFMVAAGMYSTGAITLIADVIVGLPKSLYEAHLRILPPVAGGSAFLNNTPLVAMMVPVIRDLTRTARLAASKLYIPLSFASILGGASTLIGTSTNLIISGLILDELAKTEAGAPKMEEVSIFFPTPVGLPAAVVGIAFIIVLGTRLLPKGKDEAEDDLEKRLYRAEFFIEEDSYLVGKTVQESGLAQAIGYELTSLQRAEAPEPEEPEKPKVGLFQWPKRLLGFLFRRRRAPEPEEPADIASQILEAGDTLVFTADADALPALWATIGLTPLVAPVPLDRERYKHRLVEAVVSPQHPAVGRKVSELPVRDPPPYEANLVAVSRNGRPPGESLRELVVTAGDNTVLEVGDSFFYENRNEVEFTLTRRLRGYSIRRTSRAVTATIITMVVVIVVAFGWMSMLNAALLGVFAMLATGCMGVRAAGRSVELDTLVVLAAAVGLEAAVSASGLAEAIANLLGIVAGNNPYAALTVVFFGCIVMTNLITNAAAAAFMFPITVSIVSDLDVSFMPFAVILMLGTSYAFLNPAGYQTNLMVQGPGGYEFMDYVRVGAPLTILVGIVAILLAPLVYSF